MASEDEKQLGRKFRLLRLVAILAGVLLALVAILILLLSSGVKAPEFIRADFESRINASLEKGVIGVGEINISLADKLMAPEIVIRNIELRDETGALRGVLPEVVSVFSGLSMLQGELAPISFSIPRAVLLLERDAEGQFNVSMGSDNADTLLQQNGDVGTFLKMIETAFDGEILDQLTDIRIENVEVTVADALSGRTWQFLDGAFGFSNSTEALDGSVGFKLFNESQTPAEANFSWRKEKSEDGSELTIKFSDLQTGDIAEQVVAFSWLRLLDAPISGSVSLAISEDGGFGPLYGVLDIGNGVIRQNEATKPVQFSNAKAYVSYDDEQEKLTFDQVSVNTDAAHVVAEGHAYLGDLNDRSVEAIVGQFRFTEIEINPEGMFAQPLKFDLGILDMRLRLDPLEIDIGQMVLMDAQTKIVMDGELKSMETGWSIGLDVKADTLPTQRLKDLWPLTFKKNTRKWIDLNVLDGNIRDITVALRAQPGERAETAVGFNLADMSVRFHKKMPSIQRGIGHGVLADGKLKLVLEQGTVTAPNGNHINLAGSVFSVNNTRQKGAPSKVFLKTQSSVTSLLELLDLEPFEFLRKAGVATDITEGTVITSGTIKFPLVKRVTLDLVDLAIAGQLRNLSTSKLVKGKILAAKELKGFVNNDGLTISGQAHVGKVPISGAWQQKFGPEHKGKGSVEGQIELSNVFLKEFGIALPKGAVNGTATGHMTINLARGSRPRFEIRSDLNRVQLALDVFKWRKAKIDTGSLLIKGSFGTPPEIDLISLSANGLELTGGVKLKANGKLDVAEFTEFKLQNWIDAPIDIRLDTEGKPAFTLNGGTLDFRKSRFASTTGEDAAAGNKITTHLDRLILSRGIALTDVKGELNTTGGTNGSFEARVNGGARIVGTLASSKGGTAVRFTSTDAGAVMRSTGLFESAAGGRLDMVLAPTGKRGVYDGSVHVTDTRVRNATALSSILSAISVIGLIEQLGGEGIAFSDVNARFRLTPQFVELTESSAVGTSLGLTMAGLYELSKQTLDMQGVVTPIYALNGLLEQSKIFGGLFGKKKGEGLFGFNYTLKGPVDDPVAKVNPLSILTPGLFREIFRQPVPKPEQ